MSAKKLSLIVALGLLAVTAGADTSPCPQDDMTVAELLDLATASYEEGALEQALCLLETAQAMIAAEIEVPTPVRSNAIDLLMYLDAYRAYALGSDLEDDAAWDFLTRILVMVADIESFPDPPDEWQGNRVSTWTDGKVHQIDNVNISHWADGSIHQVGSYSIGYWADRRPHTIGGIDYSYMGSEHRLDRVGSVTID